MSTRTRTAAAAAAAVVVVQLLAVAPAATAHKPAPDPVPVRAWQPCPNDEAAGGPCVWDARHMGNGHGRSFVVTARDRVRYVSHATAHALLSHRSAIR